MKFSPPKYLRATRAFTLVEIAICLGIIGVALVAIIGILPRGLRTQRDSREETVIGQDASILFEAVRNGSRGANDLTNYIFRISNAVTFFNGSGAPVATDIYGYTFTGSTINGAVAGNYPITNGQRIVGLLSAPQFWTNDPANPAHSILLPNVNAGGYSNHITAYVRALSGVVAEKPPQDNPILRDDTFSYRIYVVNAPLNLPVPDAWSSAISYPAGARVYYYLNSGRWLAVNANVGQPPGSSADWVRYGTYYDNYAFNLREYRITFFWPLLPNGGTGIGRQTFRELSRLMNQGVDQHWR